MKLVRQPERPVPKRDPPDQPVYFVRYAPTLSRNSASLSSTVGSSLAAGAGVRDAWGARRSPSARSAMSWVIFQDAMSSLLLRQMTVNSWSGNWAIAALMPHAPPVNCRRLSPRYWPGGDFRRARDRFP